MMIRLFTALCLLLGSCASAFASQGSACLPTSGVVSGLTIVQDWNAAGAAFISMNSAATAPATDCTGVAVKGQWWLDTSTTPNHVRLYDATNWLDMGAVDSASHVWTPPVGGGTLPTITSNTTTDLGSVAQAVVYVSGTTTITSFGASAVPGTRHTVIFMTSLTLTNSANILLPGGANIITQANDSMDAVYIGANVWQVITYSPASGQAINNPAVPVGAYLFTSSPALPSVNYVFGNGQALTRTAFPAYFAAATSVQTVGTTSGSPTLTGFTDTTQFAAGNVNVEGTGIPNGTTITSCTGSTCTMSANASSTAAVPVTVFFYGYGSGGTTSTVGVPNCQGVMVAGRDNMSGTPRGNITVAGSNIAGSSLGRFGGLQNGSIAQNQLPNVSPSFSGNPISNLQARDNDNHLIGSPGGSLSPASGANWAQTTGATSTVDTFTPSGSISSINGGVTQVPFAKMPPVLIANCLVRVSKLFAPLNPMADNDNRWADNRRVG